MFHLLSGAGWLLLLCILPVRAQPPVPGARSVALSNASSCLPDVYAVFNNQACLAGLERPELALSAGMRFLSPQLAVFSLAFAAPVKKYGTFGIQVQRTGYHLFSRNTVGLAYARPLGNRVWAGMLFSYHLLHIAQGYGVAHVVSAEAGLLVRITKDIYWAVHVSNPVRQQVADWQQEKLPLIFKTGFMYVWDHKLLTLAELVKDFDMPFEFRLGMEYLWKEQVAFRIGFSSLPLAPSFGLGYRHRVFRLDLAASWKRYTGFTPELSLSFPFKNRWP